MFNDYFLAINLEPLGLHKAIKLGEFKYAL